MSAPLKDKECIIAMYDSYAKTVMRNKCRNALRAKRRTVRTQEIKLQAESLKGIEIPKPEPVQKKIEETKVQKGK